MGIDAVHSAIGVTTGCFQDNDWLATMWHFQKGKTLSFSS